MGQGPITDDALAALPRGTVLGAPAVFVELEGTFAGMGGRAGRRARRCSGWCSSASEGSVFVKMTGPPRQVKAERERFRAFCESLRE